MSKSDHRDALGSDVGRLLRGARRIRASSRREADMANHKDRNGRPDATGDGQVEIALSELARLAPPMTGTAQNEPLPVRTTAPEFSLPDQRGREVSLRDFLGR